MPVLRSVGASWHLVQRNGATDGAKRTSQFGRGCVKTL